MKLGRKHTFYCFVLLLLTALPLFVFAQENKNKRPSQFLKEGDPGYDQFVMAVNNLNNDSSLYYAELLRDERKRQKLTQQQLGERIGKKREYISSLEQGQTDMQLSTFMLIANALGLRFSLVVG